MVEILNFVYIGIVGSTKRKERSMIKDIIIMEKKKHKNIVVVSGGAKGIDDDVFWSCKELGVPILTFFPNKNEYETKGDMIYFERNELIAYISDYMHGFPFRTKETKYKDGTLNTIKYFIKFGKIEKLKIYR